MDTEAIVTGAMAAAGDGEGDGEGTETVIEGAEVVVEPVIETPVVEGVVPPVIPEVVEDAFAKEHGITPFDKDGKRYNKIPYPRVKEMTQKAVGKLAELVLGKPLADGEDAHKVVAAHVARIPELEKENASYKDEIERVTKVENIIRNDPARYLQMLVAAVPAYKDLITGTGAVEKPKVEPPAGPMPEPDYEVTDTAGKVIGRSYTRDGIVKLLQWQAAQTKAEAVAELRAQIDKDYKPLKDAHDAQAQITAMAPKIRARIEQASKEWKGFAENEKEIMEVVVASNGTARALSLHEAYIQVINKKHEEALTKATTDEAALRKKIIEEMKKAPTGTSTVSSISTAKVTPDGPKTTEDIVAEAVKAAGLK